MLLMLFVLVGGIIHFCFPSREKLNRECIQQLEICNDSYTECNQTLLDFNLRGTDACF